MAITANDNHVGHVSSQFNRQGYETIICWKADAVLLAKTILDANPEFNSDIHTIVRFSEPGVDSVIYAFKSVGARNEFKEKLDVLKRALPQVALQQRQENQRKLACA